MDYIIISISVFNTILIIIILKKVISSISLIEKVNKIDDEIVKYNKKVDRLNSSLLDVRNMVNDEKYKSYKEPNKYDDNYSAKKIKTVELGKEYNYRPMTLTDTASEIYNATKRYFF